MKHIIIALSSIVLLSACNKAPTETNAENSASNSATAVASAMPAECQTYIDTVKSMVEKNPEAAKAFEEGLAQSKEAWKNLSDEQAKQAAEGCKAMNSQLEQAMSAMK